MEETIVKDADAEVSEEVNPSEGRTERLDKLAKGHSLASMGVGLVPFPLVDMVALFGIQLDLVKKLAAEYDVPFKQEIGKSIITSLAGGILPQTLGGAIASMIKVVPVIGQTTGTVAMPVFCGASTYALHKVFVQHFEAGGTLLDLDPAEVKSYFAEQFAKGKQLMRDMKKGSKAPTDADKGAA